MHELKPSRKYRPRVDVDEDSEEKNSLDDQICDWTPEFHNAAEGRGIEFGVAAEEREEVDGNEGATELRQNWQVMEQIWNSTYDTSNR